LISQEIIEECKNGDLSNFSEIIREASPFAFSVAFRMLGDSEQAKDIVQETMITTWKNLRNIKSSNSFKPWLYKIVVNKCYDCMRRSKRKPEIRADDQVWAFISNHVSSSQVSELENDEIAAIIRALTQKLSPRQKAVFILAELEEMTSEEIADITGMSKLNIKSNLYYARKKINEMIIKYI
jgi:RNA polymerase sigma-70 factor (ECF subfamily)